MLVAAAFAPRLVATIGIYRVIQIGLAGVSVCMTLLYLLEDFASWMAIRFASGFILTVILVATDSCINDLAVDRVRGRIVGLSSMSLSFGFILGPLILTVFDSRSPIPFLFAILLPFAMIVMIFGVRAGIKDLDFLNEPVSMFGFLRRIPAMIMAVVFVAFADQAALSLLPLFGLGYGRNEAAARLLVVAMTAGSFLLLYPIRWLPDILPRVGLMAASAALSALQSLGIILAA
jgi:MFS family permease